MTVSSDPMIGAFKSYDPIIEDYATDRLQQKMEQEWTNQLAIQSIIRACEMGCCSFILKVVEDTWVRRLQYSDSFYTRVSPMDLLDLLDKHSGGIERADFVAMFDTMHIWWAEDPSVPEFINRFYDTQKKATHAYL